MYLKVINIQILIENIRKDKIIQKEYTEQKKKVV